MISSKPAITFGLCTGDGLCSFKLGAEFLSKIIAHMDLIIRPVLARTCSSQPVVRRPVLDREKVRVGFWSKW